MGHEFMYQLGASFSHPFDVYVYPPCDMDRAFEFQLDYPHIEIEQAVAFWNAKNPKGERFPMRLILGR